MNILADESVDLPIVARLRAAGHDVVYVAELSPSIKDDEVLQEANRLEAVLVTVTRILESWCFDCAAFTRASCC